MSEERDLQENNDEKIPDEGLRPSAQRLFDALEGLRNERKEVNQELIKTLNNPVIPPDEKIAPHVTTESLDKSNYKLETTRNESLPPCTFSPNQVDQYQNLVIDEHGKPVHGIDEYGYPLDIFGKPFMEIEFEEKSEKEPNTCAQSTKTTKQAKHYEKMQILVPDQLDSYGVKIVDGDHYPVYGWDDSGWYVLDSAGEIYHDTKWVEEMVEVEDDGGAKFNAILVIDISRSMMARDLEVKNIEPRLKVIRQNLKSNQISEFLDQFKDKTFVARRLGAALAAITFLSEKIARGFGEKVAIIRFADVAETLDFQGFAFMESEDTAQDVIQKTAIDIIEKIGDSYGSATNMGQAMLLASEVARLMQQMEGGEQYARPIMCILLTDGYPTDGDNFIFAMKQLAKIPNLILNIFGLGSTDTELLTTAAVSFNGEFYLAESVDQILSWYANKAYFL